MTRDDYLKSIATLSAQEKRALLAKLLQERKGQASKSPLSYAQERLWFLDQLEPGSAGYNMAMAVRLEGPLRVETLERSLKAIMQRHDVLRTRFEMRDGEPVQVAEAALKLALAVVDLGRMEAKQREAEVRRLAAEEAQKPFDLRCAPLWRVKLFRLAEAEHVLMLTQHHIVSDVWSIGILLKELATLYEAFSAGEPSPLNELPIQYADFAVWQRQWLQGEVLEEQVAYWKRQLAGAPAVLELPTDRPRPPAQTSAGHTLNATLPREVLEGLQELSRHEGVTLFMTLLAAFSVLLSRYSGQQDIVVGSPIANRTRVEVEGLVGFFINTLVLRTDLSGNPTFRELLQRVREVTLGAYAHQDLPFEKLVEELRPERDLSHSPLFQMLLVLQNAPTAAREFVGLKLSPLSIERGISLFDLSLYLRESEQGLEAALEYNTDLFEGTTMKRLWGHYRTLLEGVVAAPEQPVATLTLLPEAERHQLLVEWNKTAHEYPEDECIPQLIEAQATSTPDAVAVASEAQRMTYRELNARANQLAHCLREHGVGPDILVGLCVERSVEMMVGVLGILKAGGAYVPLDPEFPRERLAFMLEDSAAPVLVTQQHLLERLPESGATVICLDRDVKTISQGSQENPVTLGNPDNLAYVIYTSGSTGKPKGVQIPHRAVVNFLNSMKSKPGIDARDVLVAVTTLSFDIAGLELYLPLTVGARVVIAGREVVSDGVQLAQLLADSQATVMQATPATWKLLLAAGWQGDRRLKMLCGGEALPPELARELVERGGELWNMYGPTETTIWSTLARVSGREEKITIGRPIDNTLVYILDPHGHPVPIGVPGELHLGGDGVARGYLNRPELTKEKFIPDPFCHKTGSRIYRTGDLARWRADGTIECLGRMDHQVKLRGFRIELGEIETVLREQAGVKDVVVVAREDTPGEKRLAAYVIPETGRDLNVSELRRQLKLKLPDYMIPAAFVLRDDFPLTPNSKVDRRALPPPEQTRAELEATYVAPTTETECTIASIWQEVLHLQRIGIHDNFFDVGGHSLLALQVMSRVHEKLGVEVPLRTIFETATVAGLAETVLQLKSQQEKREQEEVLKRIEALDEAEVDAELNKRAHATRGTDTE